MRIYEELFILDPKTPDEEVDAVVGQIEDVVKGAGGTIDKVDRWGVRKLAYRVQKREEGLYILVQFSSGAKAVHEIERRLRVHESVLKYITVRIDEKLKWLEKRKKIREKRAARKPQAAAPAAPSAPAEPPAARPGAPAPGSPRPAREPEGEGGSN
jgi:small subunit ribosomal protein S6